MAGSDPFKFIHAAPIIWAPVKFCYSLCLTVLRAHHPRQRQKLGRETAGTEREGKFVAAAVGPSAGLLLRAAKRRRDGSGICASKAEGLRWAYMCPADCRVTAYMLATSSH